jgi:hypothetical protein
VGAGEVVTIKDAIYLAVLAVLLCIGGWLYWKGGDGERAAKQENKEVAASTEVSRKTAANVDKAGAETRTATEAARGRIRERIESEPVPVGPADVDLLRVAVEAHDRAIRAACRVQRTSDCPAPAGSTGQ